VIGTGTATGAKGIYKPPVKGYLVRTCQVPPRREESVSEPSQPKILPVALRGLIKLIKAVQYYPPSHPTLLAAVRECRENFAPLLTTGDGCTFTIRKEGFFLGEEPVARQNPILGNLAPFLFARRIHTLLLLPDLSGEDLRNFARCLTLEPRELLKLGGIQEVMANTRISTIWVNEVDLSKIFARKQEIEAEKQAHPGRDEENPFGQEVGGEASPAAARAEERNLARVLQDLQQEIADQRYQALLQELTPLIHLNLTGSALPLVLDALTLLAGNARAPKLSEARREASTEALIQVASEELLDYLLAILCSKSGPDEEALDEDDKERVLEILDALQSRPTVAKLMDHLASASDGRVRKILTRALLRQGPAAMPLLTEYLEDERWIVVRNAVAILGELRDPEATPSLQPLLKHKDLRVRRETIRSLTKIGGPAAVDILLQAVAAGDQLLRRQALLSLGAMKNPAAVPTLLELVAEADPLQKRVEVKKEALKALGEIGADQAVPLLVKILGQRRFWRWSRHNEVRATAALALGEIGATAALAPLQAATEDRAANVARAAVQALKLIRRGEQE